jgi:hypothetical protein
MLQAVILLLKRVIREGYLREENFISINYRLHNKIKPCVANPKVSNYTFAMVLQAYSANNYRSTDHPTLRKP